MRPTIALLALAASVGCAPRRTGTATTAAALATHALRGAGEDRFVDSLLALMTLEEKVGQLNQLSGLAATGPGGNVAGVEMLRRGEIGSLFNVIGVDSISKIQRVAVEQSRLHIPIVFGLDVIHGYRTEFPVPLGEAASWDPALARRTAAVAAMEASAAGLHWTFAPMVDIARDARWGRIVEGAGEDPYLGSAFADARVRGFQGSSLADRTSLAATVKHFAAYGAAEAGRDYNVADISERTLREVYLPPFHAAVCAGTASVMSSFNEIAGIPAHANPLLTTQILRREWGFDGLVVSDWTGIGELLNHGIGADTADIAAAAINAGVDMDMVSESYRHALPALVRSGRVSQATLDEAVRRVLRMKYRLGLFRDPYHGATVQGEASAMLTPASRALARAAARESIVLLKNDGGVLPLRKDVKTVAVIGALAEDASAALGNWTGQARHEDAVSVLAGIRAALPGANVVFSRGASVTSDTTGIADAVAAARRADAVILVVGEVPDMSAEASSRATIDVPGAQMKLVRAVRAATSAPTVVVLMNGRPLAMQELNDVSPAIVESWFLGVEHGNAVADVIFGDYNPSGKLPVTFPRVTGQEPIYYAHKNTGRPPNDRDKYVSRYLDVSYTPLYVFGHGLSYTTFTIGAPQLGAATMGAGDTLHVRVSVTNSGRMVGTEVVQLYLRDDVSSATRPVRELRGFQRVTLAPGESRVVDFAIDARDLAFHDAGMRRVVEPGTFTVFVGNSSAATQSARLTFTSANGQPVAMAAGCPVVR